MHEKVMQKNYAKAYKLVAILAVVLAVLSAVVIPLSLSQQIRDAAALEQTYGEDRHDGEHDGHDREDAWKSQITPLTPVHFVIFGVAGVLWLALLGLTVASIPFVALAEKSALRRWQLFPFALLGAAVVVSLTMLRTSSGLLTVDMAHLQIPDAAYLFLAGAVAITAMVLPGISGSSILLIAGVYLPVIQAIRQFLRLDMQVVPGLMALGLGVIAGAALSIRAIRAALQKHRATMIWFILGLRLGSLYAIVMGPTSLQMPQPPLDAAAFRPLAFLLGAGLLAGLELLRRRMERGGAA